MAWFLRHRAFQTKVTMSQDKAFVSPLFQVRALAVSRLPSPFPRSDSQYGCGHERQKIIFHARYRPAP